MSHQVTLDAVRDFWNANPLCATNIPHPLGSREYFEFYNKLREQNETPSFSAELHEYADFAGKKVLDVGCGNGYVLSRYAQAGAEVYGVDLTATAIQLCRQRFEYMGLSGTFIEANAEALPFEDNSFDCVSSMGVLHHTPNTARAVKEVWRVLKPGGRLILMFYHRNSSYYRVALPIRALLRGKSIATLVNEYDGSENPKGDVYSRREMAVLLQDFKDLDMFVGYLTRDMTLPKLGRFIPDAVLQAMAPHWGWFLYAKGRK